MSMTVWLTGLPASGKTTLARAVTEHLRNLRIPVEHLDGDVVRDRFPAGFSPKERRAHLLRMGFLCELLNKHGVVTVCSFVSPERATRQLLRESLPGGTFLEVYVECPLDECIQRDPKGMYKKAQAGEIKDFTGIDAPYEPPQAIDVHINSAESTVEESTVQLLSRVLPLVTRAYPSPGTHPFQ